MQIPRPTPQKRFPNIASLGKITTPYGGSTRGEKQHMGVDVANREGTPIPAFGGGTVVGVGPTNNGLGNQVAIKDNKGNTAYYSHLKKAYVAPGQRVAKGQNIAAMGRSGNVYSNSGGDPSHLDVRLVNRHNKYMNPLSYISKMKYK